MDTEIIPHRYEDWGAEFSSGLLGMFAIAVWDDVRKCGLLARDHTGKKPLYHLERPGALYFGSEIKCLLAMRDYERRLNPVAVHHFLSYKHVPAPTPRSTASRASALPRRWYGWRGRGSWP